MCVIHHIIIIWCPSIAQLSPTSRVDLCVICVDTLWSVWRFCTQSTIEKSEIPHEHGCVQFHSERENDRSLPPACEFFRSKRAGRNQRAGKTGDDLSLLGHVRHCAVWHPVCHSLSLRACLSQLLHSACIFAVPLINYTFNCFICNHKGMFSIFQSEWLQHSLTRISKSSRPVKNQCWRRWLSCTQLSWSCKSFVSTWHYCDRSSYSNLTFKYKLQFDWQWRRRFVSNLFGAGIDYLRRSGHPHHATVLSQCTWRAATSPRPPYPSAATLATNCSATSRPTRSSWRWFAAKVHWAVSVRGDERDNDDDDDDDTIAGSALGPCVRIKLTYCLIIVIMFFYTRFPK